MEREQGKFRAKLFIVSRYSLNCRIARTLETCRCGEYFNEHFPRVRKYRNLGWSDRESDYRGRESSRLRNTIERVVSESCIRSPRRFTAPGKKKPRGLIQVSSFRATDAYHREFIQRKLDEAEGNVSRAAELMGVDRSHLYRRMRALGIPGRSERTAIS